LINYIHGEEVTSTTTYLLYGRNREFYLKQADAVVAVSQFTKHALIKLMHVNPEKITVIENGVNTSKFHPAPKDEKLLAKHNLVNKKVILTVGRLVERKGVDKTILALPKIIQKIPDIHYLVVGTGEFSETLKKLVAEQNLTNFVTFAGRVSEGDLVKYYQSCDLFIMPNRELADHDTEGFGLVFLEANACKKPVIGGKAGGAVEAVKDGETGILVDGNNPDEIAAAVISLLNNPDLMSKMAQTGYELAIKSSWKNKTQLFYQLCDKLLQKN
jgi:phosphatidylinositol alpha-1,6-mannosyltransferase